MGTGKSPSTKVMEIFSEAASADAASRGDFLDGACAGDDDLRAEVESLLATEKRLSAFLGSPTVGGGVESPAEHDAAAAEHDAMAIERGRALAGRYSIVERIGEGGFGVVYCARQNHPIRREVALKIVKLGMDTRQIIARFESERQALALMDHPGIARIFDAGATADGRPYFVMELVRGQPITDYCDNRRLTIAQRLELFLAVCQAVQHAHTKGIIHRDLKPTNILVAEADGGPVPKVIDFGIAKAMLSPADEHTTCTGHRHFIGTPEYMSPEQAGAGGGDVDTRSDIYSLGVLLYELLTGATPFDAKVLRDSSGDQVHQIIREDEPPGAAARLSAMGAALVEVAERRGVDGPRLRKVVSGELGWVVTRAIEKDRRRRYETAAALADDVRRYLANEPLLAGPPDTFYRVRKFSRRHRGPLLAAGAVAAALLLGLASTTYGLLRARRDHQRAEAALAEAQTISKFLADMLTAADPNETKGKPVLVRDVLDRTARTLDAGSLRDKPLAEARIRMTLGSAYESLGLLTEFEAQTRRALDIRQRVLGTDNVYTAQSMSDVAWAKYHGGDFPGAENLMRQVLAIQERLYGPNDQRLLYSLNRLGLILTAKGDTDGSVAVLRRTLQVSRAITSNPDLTATALTNLGVALLDKHDLDGAEPAFIEALALDRKLHGDKYRNVPRNMSNLAVVRQQRGDLKGAEALWMEALRIQREFLPKDHQDTAWTLRLLALLKDRQGDPAASERFCREAIEMNHKVFGPRQAVIATLHELLAKVLDKQGRAAEAGKARWESVGVWLTRWKAALQAEPESAARWGGVGQFYLRRGDLAEARRHLAEASRRAPKTTKWWPLVTCLSRYLDGDDDYRRACHEVLERFGETTDNTVAGRVATACLLGTPAEADLPRVLALAGRADYSGQKDGEYELQLCRGLAALRGGQCAVAAEGLSKLHDKAPDVTIRVASGYYLALAREASGDSAGAAAALAGAEAEWSKIVRPGEDDIGTQPEDWLICQSARREALAAITSSASDRK